MEIVHAEGDREVAREVEFYNLDAILKVYADTANHVYEQNDGWKRFRTRRCQA